jgi:signal transduction histidine kinase
LARDLHDSVVQQLFSMRMQAKALRAQLDNGDTEPAGVRRSAEELSELSASALADLRRLVFELRPLELAERGLVEAITAHAASVQARSGLAIDVLAPPDLRISGRLDLQEDLYRIVSEAVHNVVKHAGASAVRITVSVDDIDVVIEVCDDGAGGPATAPRTRGRLGLVSMRERAQRWGGQFAAGPRPDCAGWMVRVAVPLGRLDVETTR